PYFFVKRSTRPSVSISFCRPVKNGWQFEQISRCSSGLVDRVFQVAPHAQRASTSKYFGWMASFTANSLVRETTIITGQDGPEGQDGSHALSHRWVLSASTRRGGHGSLSLAARLRSTWRGLRMPGIVVLTSGCSRMNRSAI